MNRNLPDVTCGIMLLSRISCVKAAGVETPITGDKERKFGLKELNLELSRNHVVVANRD